MTRIGVKASKGPSPRGRGNPVIPSTAARCSGSIPAWAGKPRAFCMARIATQVHPRVGGETDGGSRSPGGYGGPSPRGRGNLPAELYASPRYRSIPAWAGKPSSVRPQYCRVGVHPRVGGETSTSCERCCSLSGPSPRGRGNQAEIGASRLLAGSIPAWAGRNRFVVQAFEPLLRSIPAWAGKPRADRRIHQRIEVHPRVGGETTSDIVKEELYGGPSPRGRGNRRDVNAPDPRCGSIPAWAGKPGTGSLIRRLVRVHPRVGGETSDSYVTSAVAEGPSPRGRGNPSTA